MTVMQKMERLLAEMTQSEKVELLQHLARDLSGAVPGIESTPGVSGGEPRIAGTRIPVWVLVQYRNLGASEAELLKLRNYSGWTRMILSVSKGEMIHACMENESGKLAFVGNIPPMVARSGRDL